MTENSNPQPWWQTIPGILTASAAVITAITGLVVAIKQSHTLQSSPAPTPTPLTVEATPTLTPETLTPASASDRQTPETSEKDKPKKKKSQ